jgi:hypothetical protein
LGLNCQRHGGMVLAFPWTPMNSFGMIYYREAVQFNIGVNLRGS